MYASRIARKKFNFQNYSIFFLSRVGIYSVNRKLTKIV